MAWIKVDDSFYDNDKMLAAGTIGRDMYWHGMAYCNRNLTDGLIPKGRALSLVDFTGTAVLVGMGGVDGQDCAPIAVERILDADLWHEDGHDCPTCIQPGPRHYIVHDYLEYQPSRAEVEEKRAAVSEARAAAGRAGGLKSGRVRQSKSEASSEAKLKQTSSKTEAPNPNPNPFNPLVKKEGEVTLRNAREDPPPHCSRHKENSSAPCRACGARREWEREQAAKQEQDELLARRRAKERSEKCPDCHGTNTIEVGEDAARICDHPAVAQA